jgi:hypothetical protein
MSTAPLELKQQIEKRQAVFFVGAGVSARATNNPVATWTGLLENGVRFCEANIDGLRPGWADRVRADIKSADPDDMLIAAEKITRKLGSSVNLQAWLRASIGNFQPITRDVLEAIAALNLPIMTTNYDRLLEEVTGQLPVNWREHERIRRVLVENEPGIVHIHGWFEMPDSIILDIRSYERIINNEYMSFALKSTAYAKSIIFVGFGSGLDDPNFSRLRLWIRNILANVTSRHYRLCLTSELEQLRNDHQADTFLRVLEFGANQDELAAYLRSLAPETPGLGGALQSAQASPPVAAIADPQAAKAEPQAATSMTPSGERRPLSTVPVSQVLPEIAQLSKDESTALLHAFERYAPELIEAVRQTQQAS